MSKPRLTESEFALEAFAQLATDQGRALSFATYGRVARGPT